MDDLDERVRYWTQEVADTYCKKCVDTCCNGYKHRIDISKFSLPLFQEHGVPVYKLGEFGKNAVLDKWGHVILKNQHWLKDKTSIPQPAIIENTASRGIFASEDQRPKYTLYVRNNCPLYEQEKGCIAHEDERRPQVCKDFPVFRVSDTNPWFVFHENCKSFNKEELRKAFEQAFPEAVLGFIHEKTNTFVEEKTF